MRTRSPVLSNASPPPAAASGEAVRIEWAHRGFVLEVRGAAILPDGLAVGGQRIVEDDVVSHQLIDDGWNSAGAVIILAEIFAGGLHVDEQRDVEPIFLPVVDAEL